MRFVLYTHSLVSDWNHGNAHFLRGVLADLAARGHEVLALEPADGWSRANLVADQGCAAIDAFYEAFPRLPVRTYGPDFDHAAALADADVVIVHEWTAPALVAEIGRLRRRTAFTLAFHDTHHRAVSDAGAIGDLALQDYDIVLAFGESLRQRYLARGWASAVFTWHEAADTRLFRPPEVADAPRDGDLIWIGNWGDGERAAELDTFLLGPARRLNLAGEVRGVRYPAAALAALAETHLAYRGWIANAEVPAAFARFKATIHVPRRPYAMSLPGIPTIRMFEALACGIPLVSAPWNDAEGLFRDGDYLKARDGDEMARHLETLRSDPAAARAIAANGLEAIHRRHTCAHRVDQLLDILRRRGSLRVREALTPAIPREAAQ